MPSTVSGRIQSHLPHTLSTVTFPSYDFQMLHHYFKTALLSVPEMKDIKSQHLYCISTVRYPTRAWLTWLFCLSLFHCPPTTFASGWVCRSLNLAGCLHRCAWIACHQTVESRLLASFLAELLARLSHDSF